MPQEALTLKDYLKARRTGRGTPLNRKARMEVWKVFECYQDLYKERHVRDGNMALYECSRLLLREGRTRYTHVIADEGQDFSDSAFRLLRILAGEQHKNDIFITGDTHQRIYRNHPVLSRCGIQVRGRSSILRLNYRTTEEIRKFAMEKLTGCEFDDMDEAPDAGDGCRSLMHGEAPQVRKFRDAAGEFDFLVDEIRRLKDSQVPLQDICVGARTKKLVENYAAMFTRAGIPSFLIRRSKADNRRMDGLRLATMHRVKGLEFQYVFVCAANQNILPLKGAINETDPIAKEETLTAEKCLLYVALTRARRGAWITSYGKPSEFL